MRSTTLRTILLIIIAGLLGYYIGNNNVKVAWKNYNPRIEVKNAQPPASASTLDFRLFWTVFDKLQASYYDKSAFDSQKLLNGAIQGMVASLDDPYTMYLPPTQNKDFKQGLAGKFEGIGAQLGMRDKKIVVIAPLDGSPAQKAGVRAGDTVVKVDGQFITGLTLDKVVDKIRGEKGTEVKLTVLHKDSQQPKDIKITRDEIQVKSVTNWTKKVKDIDEITMNTALKPSADNKISYIRLSQFGDTTNTEWLNLTNKLSLDMQRDKTIKGLILDLRNNPGGYLTDAVFIASEFIRDGVVVIQDDGKQQQPLKVNGRGQLYDTPVVVLINKGSASASEIVSGALRDHNRAKLVGETSFGKGTIQQAEDLGEGAGLHVTIAKWLTPNGTWVHMKGLTPDVPVSEDTKDPSRDAQLEKAIEVLLNQ